MTKVRIALALVLTMGMAGVALADDEGLMHEHHGFYLHLEGGLGGVSSHTNGNAYYESATISGGGGAFALSAGWSIGRIIVVGGEVWDMVAFSPDVSSGGETVSTDGDSSFAVVGWGPKLTVWIAPERVNMYFSATPSITQCTAEGKGGEASMEVGSGLRLALGKEWWLGQSQWGLGLSGQLVLASNKDKGSHPPDWTTVGGGINFSATWN